MEPKVYSKNEHCIRHDNVHADALYIIHRLREEGFSAYLVGGSVRDLLVGIQPKDFDISTSALPDEIKAIFKRRCLLIGRRFRLAHVRCGQHVLEVSTFRAGDTGEADLIVRDNTWGTEEEDVLRRDFTINGLFYDPEEETVIDYVGGVKDIEKRLLRTIGDPQTRFHQDPVRMTRLLKFQARLDFDIEKKTLSGLKKCKDEITKSSPARMLEETFRMLESGASAPYFQLMQDYGFNELLLPWLSDFLGGKYADEVYSLLAAADRIHQEGDGTKLSRSVLTCCLTYPILEREFKLRFEDDGMNPHMGYVIDLSLAVMEAMVNSSFSAFPRKIRTSMQYIMQTQFRVTPYFQSRIRKARLANQNDFPYALEFLRIRAAADPELAEEYKDWKARCKRRPEKAGAGASKRSRSSRSRKRGRKSRESS